MNKMIEWFYRHHLLGLSQVHVLLQTKNLLKPCLHCENYQITLHHSI